MPAIVNLCFSGVDGEALLHELDREGISVSTGSACSAARPGPSHVLTAMGLPPADAHASVRFSLGEGNDEAEIDWILEATPAALARLRAMNARACVAAPSRGRRRTMDQNEQFRLKVGLAEMLKGGVIMDVMTADQARIAEESGACAVMALERIPAIIRREGGVARMSDPRLIREIEAAVSIPVMAKCRIGHLAEAQILEALGVDFIDESEVLTPADEENHIDKHGFKVPFVCGCRDLGEALRRIGEGAAMIRTKGEAGTGDIVEAVRHMRAVQQEIRRIQGLRDEELMAAAKQLGAPYEIVLQVQGAREAAGARTSPPAAWPRPRTPRS